MASRFSAARLVSPPGRVSKALANSSADIVQYGDESPKQSSPQVVPSGLSKTKVENFAKLSQTDQRRECIGPVEDGWTLAAAEIVSTAGVEAFDSP